MKLRKAFQTYGVIRIEDLSKVDFSQVGETSAETIRTNLLDPPTQFVLKWDSEPTFIADGTVIPIETLTHSEALALMSTNTWSLPDPDLE